jgi:hypothetical protein
MLNATDRRKGRKHRVGRVLSFFSSRNWDSPTHHPQASMPPHPLVTGGGAHARGRGGWGSPNSDDGTHTVVICKCKYFVAETYELVKEPKNL